MRSPPESLTPAALILAASLATPCSGPLTAWAEAGAAQGSDAPIARAQVSALAAQLRSDPNLGGTESVKTLRWSHPRGAATAAEPAPAWLGGLIDFLARSSSVLVWVAGTITAAIALVWAARVATARAPAMLAPVPLASSRMRDLDLRPESLPDNVGAVALELFEAGRTREALSLMYRGSLSRAVHRHQVSIGESYTEGEVLAAVRATLDARRAAYIREVIATRQRVVYAGEAVLHERFARLCRTFAPTLDRGA